MIDVLHLSARADALSATREWGDDMLDRHPVLRLSPDPLRWVVKRTGRRRACRSGEALPPGEAVVGFVLSGALGVFDARGLACVSLLGPGATYGWETAFAPLVDSHRLALLDSSWIEAPVSGIRDAMGSSWLEHVFARHALDRITRLKADSACHAAHAIPLRTANLILRLHEAGGAEVRTTQSSLAAAMGVQRTSVNAAVKALENEGAVSLTRGRIQILSVERLADAACGC